MATQTVVPALSGIQPGIQREPAPASAAVRTPRSDHNLRRNFGTLAFFAAAATAEALIPKFRFLLFQLPYFIAPVLVSLVFNYLRDFNPARAPSVLAHDSVLRLRLQRVRNALGWTAFATLVLGFTALAFAYRNDNCTCEDHPTLFIAWLATEAISFLGCISLSAYIRERSELRAGGVSSGNWSAARNRVSESKPLRSDHWGHQPQR